MTAGPALRGRVRRLPGLLLLLAFLQLGFDQLNALAPMRTQAALAHGATLLAAERAVGIRVEVPASRWLVQHHLLALLCNWSYNLCQVLLTTVVLLVLWWLRPPAYRRLRWILLTTNLVAVGVFWTWPVAPPRLVPHSGVVDVVARVHFPFGWSAGVLPEDPGQFQALPSLHAAWATWAGLALWSLAGTRPRPRRAVLRGAAAGYPVAVAVLVIVTGTHSVIDVVAGAATALLPAAGWWLRTRHATPAGPVAAGNTGAT